MFNKSLFSRLIISIIIMVISTIIGVISFITLPDRKVFAFTATDYQAVPPFVTAGVPPLLMLVMGRDHKLYYEAYNDASDLNDDAKLDVGYNPAIDYYGYFDSYKYYSYSTTNARFEPAGVTANKKAAAGSYWSGDFLNYLTMTRMDCLRKVLYGGFRSTDTATETVLQRVYVPQDAHSWGKEYKVAGRDASNNVLPYDIRDYTPLELPKGGSRHLFASTTLSDDGTNPNLTKPILRVLENSVFRIWNWVAIERPVAGSQGDDGTGRRAITANNTSGVAFDLTTGAVGIADDSYVAGAGPSVIKSDNFNGASMTSDWLWADKDNQAVTTAPSQTGGELNITIKSGDVWGGSDRFGASYLNDIDGNFDFKLKITQQGNSTGWAKAGIMVRNDMTVDNSTGYCMVAVTPSSGFAFQRDEDNTGFLEANTNTGSATPPQWIRLTKLGTAFSAYYGSNGSTWTQLGSTRTITTATTVQDVGIFVCSNNTGTASACKFDEMELTTLVPIPPDPALAFDDINTTTWNYPDEPSSATPIWIEFAFNTPDEAKTYSINPGASITDYPKSWTLEGSADRVTWTVLDTVSNQTLTAGTVTPFTCDNTGIYKYYRLIITESSLSGTAGLSIAEIQLLTDPIPATATLTDYIVRVKVCDYAIGLEPNSKLYPGNGSTVLPVYKPIGILQRHGESNRMYFGLITGSYTKNTSGGVLRKNIRSINDEINAQTGEFIYQDATTTEGIIRTIDLFRTVGFDYGSQSYNSNCGWVTTRAVNEGECRMWGNPIAEMMYEGLRYFSGAASPTSDFAYTGSGDDATLGLPQPTWRNPYLNAEDINGNGSLDTGEDANGNGALNGFDYCAKPFMLVLSDINPTYDSNQLPGNAFGGTVSTTLGTMNVTSLANTISTNEGNITNHFIGHNGATYDGACSPKTLGGFGNIRGLCPEDPTKQGSYYSAAVAYYGNINDVNTTASGDQKVSSYCVGLASPLPTIDIKVGTGTITLVPFGKSVGGSSISAATGSFQPTNTIVDFFVEDITDTYGKFRINYEDVEQGADHDMDAIVEYTYQVKDASGNAVTDPALGVKVDITLNSSYAAGGIMQHMGYIVSGSTKDGTYLEVRDKDTAAASDPDYFLDTPPGVDPATATSWDDNVGLPSSVHPPVIATRTFFPGTGTGATFLKNPLWYAAKWGGFDDYNANSKPDTDSADPTKNNEWDTDQDGIPDTYFYVQNANKLEDQLNASFADILRRTSSGTAASVISQSRSGEGAVYQAVFYPEYKDGLGNTISWVGNVHALFIDSSGNMREDTNNNDALDTTSDQIIVFEGTTLKKYAPDETTTPTFTGTIDDIKFLWSATDWLNSMSDSEAKAQRVNYSDITKNRYIFTFADADNDMIPDSGEVLPFEYPSATPSLTDTTKIFPYINVFPTFEDEPTLIQAMRAVGTFSDFLPRQYERVINYIRGADQAEFISTTTPQYIIPAFRSRQADSDGDGIVNTWRLGDIVYSTPTVVGKPAENYHILYNDKSYGKFLSAFQSRRQVIYAGGNDGMLHAFNGGFYDYTTHAFQKTDASTTATEAQYDLGAEMWAYIPYNLLPHLYWLTETSYPHVYYCDLQPKVFDAKILPAGTHYDSGSELNWGTFLVAGMRLGGGEIKADMNKTDGIVPVTTDRTMKSAYFIFDITDPETPPVLLAELSLPYMGYTTCYPAVIPIKTKGSTYNEWYLVFGSGPASSSGSPAPAFAAGGSNALTSAISEQAGKIFVVDLQALVTNKQVKTLTNDNGVFSDGVTANATYYKSLDANSFISDPATVDVNLDFAPEAVYFGTVAGNSSGWNGKMRRIVINNNKPAASPANWTGDSVLIETPGQPISSKANTSIDDLGRLWIYFGTGRYYIKADEPITAQQTFYGIIEPFYDKQTLANPTGAALENGTKGYMDIFSLEDTNQNCTLDDNEDKNGDNILSVPPDYLTWATVNNPKISATYATALIDVSKAVIKSDKSVSGVKYGGSSGTDITKWSSTTAPLGLIENIDAYISTGGGWFMDFRLPADLNTNSAKERSISQSTVFGEMVLFTTYIPSGNMCEFQGESNLYALYYKTGTPYYEDVLFDANGNALSTGTTVKTMVKMIDLGDGLASTPNIHSSTGDDGGDSTFIQTSVGTIVKMKQVFPSKRNLGIVTWKEGETECD